MKHTETKYLRVFNLGDYEKEEITIGFIPDDDATLADVVAHLDKIQVELANISIKKKRAVAAAKKAAAQAQGVK
jgi:hypothetical protein